MKASIRYIAHRPNLEKERGARELFTNASEALSKTEAYRIIDEAKKGTKFIRIVLSPDPSREDTKGDLPLRRVTSETLSALQMRLNTPVQFIAALHDDHTDIRHVHIIALVSRSLTVQDFQAMRTAATSEALAQRQFLDRTVTLSLTRGIQTAEKSRVVVTDQHERRTEQSQSQTIQVPGEPAPVCPKAGREAHEVATITPDLSWCRTCQEVIQDRQLTLSSKQPNRQQEHGLELSLSY